MSGNQLAAQRSIGAPNSDAQRIDNNNAWNAARARDHANTNATAHAQRTANNQQYFAAQQTSRADDGGSGRSYRNNLVLAQLADPNVSTSTRADIFRNARSANKVATAYHQSDGAQFERAHRLGYNDSQMKLAADHAIETQAFSRWCRKDPDNIKDPKTYQLAGGAAYDKHVQAQAAATQAAADSVRAWFRENKNAGWKEFRRAFG